MTTLNELIKTLTDLQAKGHGDKQVYYRHGAFGKCGKLSYSFVTSHVSENGPFDLDSGEEYVTIEDED